MRKIGTSMLILLFVLISGNALAQELEIEYFSDWLVVVRGNAPKSLWLGVTAIIEDTEKDFKAVKVNGKFEYRYNVDQGGIIGSLSGTSIWWVASLWEKKVYNCGCEYCKRNGYHLEGRVIRAE